MLGVLRVFLGGRGDKKCWSNVGNGEKHMGGSMLCNVLAEKPRGSWFSHFMSSGFVRSCFPLCLKETY